MDSFAAFDFRSVSIIKSHKKNSLVPMCSCTSGKAQADRAQSLHRAIHRRAARERPRLPGSGRGMSTRRCLLKSQHPRHDCDPWLAWHRYRLVLALSLSSRLLSCSSEGMCLFPLPTRMQMATSCSSTVSLSSHTTDEEDANERICLIRDEDKGLAVRPLWRAQQPHRVPRRQCV